MRISQPDLDYPPVRRPSHLVILTVLSWQLKLTNTHNTFLCLFSLSPGMLDTECQWVRVRRKLLSLASLELISQLHPGDTVAALPVSTHATLSKLSLCVSVSCHLVNVPVPGIPSSNYVCSCLFTALRCDLWALLSRNVLALDGQTVFLFRRQELGLGGPWLTHLSLPTKLPIIGWLRP